MPGREVKITEIPLSYFLIFGLILRLTIFYYSHQNQNIGSHLLVIKNGETIDQPDYETLAENLLKYNSFSPPRDTLDVSKYSLYEMSFYICYYPDSLRLPGYPLFIALLYKIMGIRPLMVILVQIFLSLISIVLVHRISTLSFNNKKITSIACLLYTLDIHSAYVSTLLLTDTLFVIFFLLSLFYFFNYLKNNKVLILTLSAVMMGIANLIRPGVLLYPVVLLIIMLSFQKQNWITILKPICIFSTIVLLMTGTWDFRNYIKYGYWRLTTQAGYAILMDDVAFTEARITNESPDSVVVRLQKQADSLGFRKESNIFKKSNIYIRMAEKYIINHKKEFLLTQLYGGLHSFISVGNIGMAKDFGWKSGSEKGFLHISFHRIAENFSHKKQAALGITILLIMGFQYFGAILGFLYIGKSGNILFLALCLLTIIYFTVLTSAMSMYRYKLPFTPLLCIAAGYGYNYILMKFQRRIKEPYV